jgi:UrcA family protein
VFHTHIAGDGDTSTTTSFQERIMTTTISRALAVAGAFAALTVATNSFAAAPSVDVRTVSVRYDDLNLSSSAGVDALYRRISSAARQVCPEIYARNLNVVIAGQRCQADAIAKAVGEINNPHLAMVHAARTSHG